MLIARWMPVPSPARSASASYEKLRLGEIGEMHAQKRRALAGKLALGIILQVLIERGEHAVGLSALEMQQHRRMPWRPIS